MYSSDQIDNLIEQTIDKDEFDNILEGDLCNKTQEVIPKQQLNIG